MDLKKIAAEAVAEDAELSVAEDYGTSEGALKGWLTRRRGVGQDDFAKGLRKILEDGSVDVRFRNEEEHGALMSAASDFHKKYGSMRIQLPIGRKMFFAPSEYAVKRHRGNLASAWAEYAIHAVTNDEIDNSGKHYRSFNAEKVDKVIPRIREIVDTDQTTIVKNDRVAYHMQLDDRHIARLIANPEFGDLRVDDLVEVTTVYTRGKVPLASKPLSQAVEEWKAGRGPSLNSAT